MSTPNFQISTQNDVQSDVNLPTETTEYERFEVLARRLVSVPKADIDAKRRKANA